LAQLESEVVEVAVRRGMGAVARYSLCAAVAAGVNAIAAPSAGPRLGGSSGAPPTVVINGRKRADTLTSFASVPTGSGTVGLA